MSRNISSQEILTRHHQICEGNFITFMQNYISEFGNSFKEELIIPNYIQENLSKYSYFCIARVSNNYLFNLQERHILADNISCYPAELISILMEESSIINIVQGRKIIEGNYYSFTMLECCNKENNEYTYYDLIEDPLMDIDLEHPITC